MKAYRNYLIFCLILVLCMVSLGGVTRLTGSGLSIVEWKPISGILPPLNATQWQEEFTAYQASPEYTLKNFHMELEDFKGIFWLEYLHRVLGRIIGLSFLLPAIYYAIRCNIPKMFIRRNFVLVGLVGMQGLMGWLMVKSGLTDNPHVSHYRLCAHLCLAILIASVIFITIKQVKVNSAHISDSDKALAHKSWSKISLIVLSLIVIQIIYGAFVAGLKAGYIYNEYPLMAGGFLPPEQWQNNNLSNFFEHHATVQFIHRWLGALVLLMIIYQYIKSITASKKLRILNPAMFVLLVATLQFGLGIITLISHVQITLATLHQLIAIILVLAQLNLIYIKNPRLIKLDNTI
jgi:cytochrome c oxidase assembly protein subunit 15